MRHPFSSFILACLLVLFNTVLRGQTTVFNFTGSDQVYVVPENVFAIEVKLWGAGGAKGYPYSGSQTGSGGGGGFTKGTLAVSPGDTLTVIVGEGGQYSNLFKPVGYGGGGAGFGQGGGRSAIRLDTNEILTAGGGGGGTSSTGWDNLSFGGAGGGLNGTGSVNLQSGGGGTQTSGGLASAYNAATAGSKFTGGSGARIAGGFGSSGGGGYYGGGGANVGIGGGGSGFIGNATFAFTAAGTGGLPPDISDIDYAAGIGAGGITGAGGHGLVVIKPSCNLVSALIANNDTLICKGENINLSASFGVTAASILWSPSAGLSDTSGSEVTATPDASIIYVVTATDLQGCVTSDTIQIEVKPAPEKPELVFSGDSLICNDIYDNYYWHYEGNIINGAGENYLLPNAIGSYFLRVSLDGCAAQSDTFLYSNTGNLDFVDLGRKFYLFPNPAERVVQLSNSDFVKLVSISDVSGRQVLQAMGDVPDSVIDLNHLPSGIYVVKLLLYDNRVVYHKLLKKQSH
jgi:hypothetical protein